MKHFLSVFVLIFAAGSVSFAKDIPVVIQKDIGLAQNFGSVPVGTSIGMHWNLRAKDLDLQIQSITLQGEGFILDTDCPVILPALQKCKVGIIFAPIKQGPHQAQLVVDLYSDRFIINTQGEGQ